MTQSSPYISSNLKNSVLDFCRHIGGKSELLAVGIVGNNSINVPSSKSLMEIVAVIKDFQPRIMTYLRNFEKTVMIVAIDKWVFERDIERGFLGESIASKLIYPHLALCGDTYLREEEIILKKRLILELLQNLVLSYPELAYRLQIKPQYFMYEVMLNRVKIFPLISSAVSNLMENGKLRNESEALKSYLSALNQLETEKDYQFFK